ncbi:hypothetical protein Sru01_36530 [Sphaerisporangium rufum]|uniref:Uncharacterized protein n=1 Tax=Sphaerisporangium rufum TaxID=1381558 RepID=A0A919UZ30_9ACTN|nr:DUF5682 family protein [Sphaerisporangium rufum]GII78671.1 hypothetical protein Sru01_36530 [Sphaerisporangium rufum]
MTTFTVMGVRHHGPGSARAVAAELARLRPDIVLIEGPPEADPLVHLAGDPGMEPPVALLAHVPGESSRAAFWPFAAFSPEWQAIRHALAAGVPVRFCDLPAAHALAEPVPGLAEPAAPGPGSAGSGPAPAGSGPGAGSDQAPGDRDAGQVPAGPETRADDAGGAPGAPVVGERRDPIGELARAAGYDDPERWWEDAVEHRGDTPFEVIADAMAAVREGHVPDEREARREAYMRRTMRAAAKEGYRNVAVVCGAWHVPALVRPGPGAPDDRLLKGLPKVKVEVTWVPWTYGRLASWSGYGAGVTSPGWYDHLFAAADRPVERWLAAAAAVLREEDLPVSSAHVIEAVRLAEALATVRGRPLAGLGEVTEAVRAVLCEGDDLPVELVQRRMVVGERLGAVPDTTPMVPLQRDLRDRQRRLKLRAEALERELDLDLRKQLDLDRSRLLHRLALLGVPWGRPREARGKGTFRESWTLEWRPEFDIELIEAGAYGTTVPAAATGRVRELAGPGSRPPDPAGPGAARRPGRTAASLAELTGLAERCLLADLPGALPAVLSAISARAALDNDVTHLMAALPALVRAQRYGDVRGTPADGLAGIVASLLDRVCAGLPAAVTGLDDDAARELAGHIDAVHAAAGLLGSRGDAWTAALRGLAGRRGLPGLIDGRLTRILLDAGEFAAEEVARRMSRSMSPGNPPARAATWVEGFLSGGGLLLVHDQALLGLVDAWLTGLSGEAFVDVLPLLRRTFGAFPAPERRAVGRRVAAGETAAAAPETDEERAAPAVRTVLAILGRA